VAYIGVDELSVRAEFAQLASESLTCIVVATGDDNAVAFSRKGQGRCASDSS